MMLPLERRNIYFDLVGPEKGATVCFGHSLSSDSGMWAEQVPVLLQDGFRVLRIDMRGHGGSDAPPGIYQMEQLADDTAQVIDALGIPQVHFIGLSIGGMFGQALGFKYGAKIKSLMLCDTRAAAPAHDSARRAPVIAAVQEANSLAPMADEAMERWFSPNFKQRNPARWKQIRDIILGTKPQGYIGCATAIQNFDFTAHSPNIKAPTLVMRGSDDKGATPEESRRLVSLIPNAKYEEIPGARHVCNVEFPDEFNRIMMNWLKSND